MDECVESGDFAAFLTGVYMELTVKTINDMEDTIKIIIKHEKEQYIKNLITDIQYIFRPDGNFISPFTHKYDKKHIEPWLYNACNLLRIRIIERKISEVDMSLNLQKLMFMGI